MTDILVFYENFENHKDSMLFIKENLVLFNLCIATYVNINKIQYA